MIQVKVFVEDAEEIESKVNAWLENEQSRPESYFKLIDTTTILTEGYKQDYHGPRVLTTITYDLKRKQESTSFYRR